MALQRVPLNVNSRKLPIPTKTRKVQQSAKKRVLVTKKGTQNYQHTMGAKEK